MALVTVQRSPSVSNSPQSSVSFVTLCVFVDSCCQIQPRKHCLEIYFQRCTRLYTRKPIVNRLDSRESVFPLFGVLTVNRQRESGKIQSSLSAYVNGVTVNESSLRSWKNHTPGKQTLACVDVSLPRRKITT